MEIVQSEFYRVQVPLVVPLVVQLFSLALLYSRVYIPSKCNTTMFPHESRQKYTDYTHRKESRDLHTLIPPPQRTCPALSGLSPNLKKRAELLVCGRVAIVDAWGMRGWDVFSVRVSGS